MTLELIFWTIIALLGLVVIPISMIWSMIDHLRGRGSQRTGSGGISAGIGAALQELDRIMTRPSVEHKVETENRALKREDDESGE
jgi:hypothetical protein